MLKWADILGQEKQKPYFQEVLSSVDRECATGQKIFPAKKDVFNAFRWCEFDRLKIVILGQDPYHGVGQAHGLSFSVPRGVMPPPSLLNVYKALNKDIGMPIPSHGCLTEWAEQGVFLLNTVLTVRAHEAHSHKNIGWERFTDAVIEKISQHKSHVVFMLWGAHAQKKASLIDESKHLILTASHPSPLSAHRGFLDCAHFSKANAYLQAYGVAPVEWSLSECF